MHVRVRESGGGTPLRRRRAGFGACGAGWMRVGYHQDLATDGKFDLKKTAPSAIPSAAGPRTPSPVAALRLPMLARVMCLAVCCLQRCWCRLRRRCVHCLRRLYCPLCSPPRLFPHPSAPALLSMHSPSPICLLPQPPLPSVSTAPTVSTFMPASRRLRRHICFCFASVPPSPPRPAGAVRCNLVHRRSRPLTACR